MSSKQKIGIAVCYFHNFRSPNERISPQIIRFSFKKIHISTKLGSGPIDFYIKKGYNEVTHKENHPRWRSIMKRQFINLTKSKVRRKFADELFDFWGFDYTSIEAELQNTPQIIIRYGPEHIKLSNKLAQRKLDAITNPGDKEAFVAALAIKINALCDNGQMKSAQSIAKYLNTFFWEL